MNKRFQRAAWAIAAAPLLFAAAAATASVQAAPAASAAAAAPQGPGYGPGGGNGPGWGMGPGMMGGYGPGYGHGFGPGYGRGYGGGYGPGMMGGACGYGYGPGMMGGFGPGAWGMGPGMKGYGFGFGGWGGGLDLSQAQVQKIDQIQKAMFDKQWPLMQAMHETLMQGAWAAPGAKLDVDAVMKRAKALSDLRLQMLRNRLETLQQFQAVLTSKQREELREYGPWGR